MKEYFNKLWNNKLVKIIGSIVIGFLVLSLVFYVANTYPRASVMSDYLKKQEEALIKKHDEQIALKNGEIDSLNFKVNELQQQYNSLKSGYMKLKKEKENVQKPQTSNDTRNRLVGLGYHPK
jgi:peptidoglycan hydrolase CwlO-like protein